MTETTITKRVMGIFAHPDDPEFFAGATFAKWAASGAHLTFVLATSGDKGSADPEMTSERLVEIREQEERNAAAALGVKEVIFLRYPDGELEPSLALRRDLTRVIRMKKPDIVVTCDPTVFWSGSFSINHPDHRAIGEAVLAAVYPTARDRLNYIEMERDEGLSVHKVHQVYISGTQEPTVKVDITQHLDTKIASLRHHISQIADMDAMAARVKDRSLDPEAPIDQPRYIERFHVITLG
ncbi:MAG TPA: PIG-L deacetylase family protein [Phototrophicaceae bacterium]|nr:PIG-L deacetylase family protein [Phototrophicaceae bacterium]